MSFQYSPFAVPLFLAAVMAAGLAWYSFRRCQQPEAIVFGLTTASLCWWSLLYALTIMATDLETKSLLNRLKYVGVIPVPPLWVILALHYTQHRAALTRRNIVLLFLPAIILLPIVLTDHMTGLWWPEKWLGEFGGRPILAHSHGLPYYIHVGISYLYVLFGLGLYVRFAMRTQRIYRFQTSLMVVAAAVPLVASALTQVGLSPLPWGLDSFFFTLSSVLIAIAVFRYRFLDIMPVARRTVVEQIPQGVIVIDANGRIVDANPAARALIQADQELVGQSLPESVQDPTLREALIEMTQNSQNQASSRDIDLSANGELTVLSVTSTPLVHQSLHLIGQIILLQDISERTAARRRLEALYRETEIERKRLSLTIRTASDAIALLDAEGNVLADNPTAHAILDTKQSADFPPALQAVLAQAEQTGDLVKSEIDLGDRAYHVVAAPIAGTGMVFTMHDVTDFRQLARLKDDFVSTVSHDLRAPLTSILGYARFAQIDGTSQQEQVEAIKRIEASAARMSELINDLLNLAKLEAGGADKLVAVELDKLARIVIEELEGAALDKGLTIRYELNPHPILEADPRLVIQMWRNLIDNAIKYTDKGTISIRVRTVEGYVLGQVADTGIGIAPADLPYVFDKFYRAQRSETQEITGTGLGLALVKTIVEKHGGQIWAESELGVGSTFTFALPLHSDAGYGSPIQ
jgi:PAS domain S-box-containing protein